MVHNRMAGGLAAGGGGGGEAGRAAKRSTKGLWSLLNLDLGCMTVSRQYGQVIGIEMDERFRRRGD
jgi:hypothetical protein